jgi:hypothetical protein
MAISESPIAAASGATGFVITAAAWVLGGALIAAFVLVTILVMVAKQPRTTKEWATALISTLFSSFGFGAYAVLYLGLHTKFHSADTLEVYLSILSMSGMVFACGLPGWVIVRVLFNTMESLQDKTVPEVVKAAKEVL